MHDQPFLFGNHAALADIGIAPFVRQFSRTDASWFGAQAWPQLQAWLAQWEGSAAFVGVMKQYASWQPGTRGAVFPAN